MASGRFQMLFLFVAFLSVDCAEGNKRVVVQCDGVKMVIPVKDPGATVESLIMEVNNRVAKHRKFKDQNVRVVELMVSGAALDDNDIISDVVQDMDVLEATMEEEGGSSESAGSGTCGANGGPGCEKPQLCDFDVVKAADMDKKRFSEEFHDKKPVLITFDEGASAWTDPALWEFASLAKRHGSKMTFAGYSDILVAFGGKGYDKVKIKDFIDKHVDNAPDGEIKYLCDPGLFGKLKDMSEPIKLPDYVNTNPSTTGNLFFLGKTGSSISFYMTGDSWSALGVGEKDWYLYPPAHVHHRTVPGGLPCQNDMASWVENILPDLGEDDMPVQCTQKAGDLLYVPELWFRAEVNTKDSSSVNFQAKNSAARDRTNNFSGGDLVSSVLGGKSMQKNGDAKNLEIVEAVLSKMRDVTHGKSSMYHTMSGQRYTYFGAAHKLYKKEWTEKAKEHLSKAVEMNPYDAGTFNNLGYALQSNGEYEDAREAFETAYKLAPKSLDTIGGLTDFLLAGTEIDRLQGKEIYEKALLENRYKDGTGRQIIDNMLAGKFDGTASQQG